MSRFYANIVGNRGQATRQGTKDSGIEGHVRGWDSGAKVYCEANSKDQDVVEVYLTRGSNGQGSSPNGLVVRIVDGKLDFLTTKKN